MLTCVLPAPLLVAFVCWCCADGRQIIFSSKKRNCDKLAQAAWDRGFAVDSLHGDREQWERTKVMDQYRSGEVRLLVATDVAARGLDVKDISYVINYDFPVDGVEVSMAWG